MATVKVQTNFNIELDFEIPEFHRRMFAWAIDLFLQIFYLIIATKLYAYFIGNRADGYDSWAIGWLILLPYLLYHLVMEVTMNGQSVGKKIMSIRVVNENGGKASISQFIIRWLIRTGDILAVFLIILLILAPYGVMNLPWALVGSFCLLITDIVLVASSKKGQRLGDIIAHTILIRTRTQGRMDELVFLEVADNYVPAFPEIMRLSDKDINSIKSILDSSRKKGDIQLADMASAKIKNHLNIQSDLPPFDFLDTLLKDYNYLSTK